MEGELDTVRMHKVVVHMYRCPEPVRELLSTSTLKNFSIAHVSERAVLCQTQQYVCSVLSMEKDRLFVSSHGSRVTCLSMPEYTFFLFMVDALSVPVATDKRIVYHLLQEKLYISHKSALITSGNGRCSCWVRSFR